MTSSSFREKLIAKFGAPEPFNSNNAWGFGGGIGDRWSDTVTVVKVFTAYTRHGNPVKALTITVSGRRVFDEVQGSRMFDLAARMLLLDRPIPVVS